MFKKYYLAYGSNLNLHQMSYRCPSARQIGRIYLKDYRLVYKGSKDGYGYLTIEKCDEGVVPLGVFEVSYFDIFSLDVYEGYPSVYTKCYIPLKFGDKIKKAFIYVMNDSFDYHLPRMEYIETCREGYRNFGFDTAILNQALVDTYDNLTFQKIRKKGINKNS